MKIAFVGKGGSGKSTISSLFSHHLAKDAKNKVCLFDADINLNLSSLFNYIIEKDKLISYGVNPIIIREYLIGKNTKIESPKVFIKSTPPGRGSNFFEIHENNFIIKKFAKKVRRNFYLINVGTYEEEGIGRSCFHTNLSIFENILSHFKNGPNQFLVADMVAGTDSFSNTLHLQFNIIFLIFEPVIESINVAKKFIDLSKKAKIRKKVFLIANKIEEEDEIKWLKKHQLNPDVIIKYKRRVKKIRQSESKTISDFYSSLKKELTEIESIVSNVNYDPNDDLKKLQQLHLQICQLDYIKRLGNLENQIDLNFHF